LEIHVLEPSSREPSSVRVATVRIACRSEPPPASVSALVAAHRAGQAHPAAGQLLGDQCEARARDAEPAVLRWDHRAVDAEALHRLDQRLGVGVVVLELPDDRPHTALDPVVDDRDDVALVGVEILAPQCGHGVLSVVSSRTPIAYSPGCVR
jgi:hypothetical protein